MLVSRYYCIKAHKQPLPVLNEHAPNSVVLYYRNYEELRLVLPSKARLASLLRTAVSLQCGMTSDLSESYFFTSQMLI